MTILQILFWISLLYAFYIVALYPLLLAGMARLKPRPVLRASCTPSVSIIIAVHNGALFLREKLESIFALDYPHERMEIIVVNDGSTDSTSSIAASFAGRVKLINSPKVGKPGALNQGIAAANGEILVLTDVRQRLAPDSLRLLMENFADPRVGAASAELQIQPGSSTEEQVIGSYWYYERWIRLNLSAVDSIFGATGSYYAIRRELAVHIPPDMLVDDMYLPLDAFFKSYRLVVDRRARMYDYPTSMSIEFSRKVRTLAGNYQILRCYPELLGPNNRLLFHYVSYKFGRLMLPFAFLICGISSLCAGGTLAVSSAIVQIVFYTAAAVDPKIRSKNVLKRFTAPIRGMIVMMLATLCAASIWFVPPERFWKATRVRRRDVPA